MFNIAFKSINKLFCDVCDINSELRLTIASQHILSLLNDFEFYIFTVVRKIQPVEQILADFMLFFVTHVTLFQS